MLQISRDYLDDLMVRMAHHSTAIEGNSLTQGETKSMLIDNYLPRAMELQNTELQRMQMIHGGEKINVQIQTNILSEI